MKQLILLLLFCFFISCNNRPEKKAVPVKIDSIKTDTIINNNFEIKQPHFYVKDTSKYDKLFLETAKTYNEPIKIIDSIIIVSNDTMYFPNELKLKREYIFKGKKDSLSFDLKVTRINYTSLIFDFKISDQKKNIVEKKRGKAVLNGLFFLGSEMDEDDKTGYGYSSSEYSVENKDYYLSIRIGEKDEKGNINTKMIISYNDNKMKSLTLENCPTLRN